MTRAIALAARVVRPIRPIVDLVFPRGALLLSILTLATYGMGLLRNRVFLNAYGLGAEYDAYLYAFFVPEIAFDVIAASGLAAPFVPILARLKRDDRAAAERFAQTVVTSIVAVMTVVSVVLAIAAPWVAEVAAPSFDPATRALYAEFLRVAALIQIIFATSLGLAEILVSERRFLAYQLAPILYYGGLIAGTLLLHDRLGIQAAAVGAVAGALLHLGARLVGVARLGFPLRPRLAVRTPAFREFVRLMVPKMVTTPIEPIQFQVFNFLAAGLAAGSVAALSVAKDFQGAPVNVIGVAFSLAIFPVLSASAAAGDRTAFTAVIRRNLLVVGGLSVLAAGALVVLGPRFVTLFRGGAFDDAGEQRVVAALLAFAISVPFDALQYPLARALYATRNTLLQVLASLSGLVVAIALSAGLVGTLGLVAIPVGLRGRHGHEVPAHDRRARRPHPADGASPAGGRGRALTLSPRSAASTSRWVASGRRR